MVTNEEWNNLAAEIHQDCVDAGWWKPYTIKLSRYCTAMMLVISEIAEAMEGDRKNLQDDHLPQHKMLHVEIADAFIRLLDGAGAWHVKIVINRSYIDRMKAAFKFDSIPEQLYAICRILTKDYETQSVLSAIHALIAFSEMHGIDYIKIIQEKRAYNKQRNDHKIEVRENTENGKKY